MDYEKKYKEALEIAQKLYQDCPNGKNDRLYHTTDLEKMFPELRESEDEKIKKELIEHIKDQQSSFISAPDCRDKYEEEENNKYNSWLAWLKKQGEQKPICLLDNSKSNVKFPFKAKVKSNGKIVTIHGGQLSMDCKEWIKYQSDVKDGYMVYKPEDLELVCNIEQNPIIEMITPEESLGIDSETYNDIVNACIFGENKPKFKVGDTIKKESTGDIVTISEIDLKNREYRLSNTGFIPFKYEHLWELVEQKPAWSEEDEKEYKYVLKFVDNILNNCGNKKDYDHCKRCYDWLKSLKRG